MENERLTVALQDIELDQILNEIKIDLSGLGIKAVDFIYKMTYFDMSKGVDADLCYLLISRWTTNHIPNNTIKEEEAKSVLKILQNHKLIQEKQQKKTNCSKSFQMVPSVHLKLSIQNRNNSSIIVDLVDVLLRIWMYSNDARWFTSMSDILHIHKSLKDFNWPDATIKWSVYFAVEQLIDKCDMEMGLEMLKDVIEFFKSVQFKSSKSAEVESYWLAIQMIQIYNDTLKKSRKILQPSDTICIESIDGTTQDIRLDNYGSWILNQIRAYTGSELDCDALLLVGEATFYRLQKHARFCNKPEESSLNWIISYNAKNWYNLNCFAALACFPPTDGWVEKICRAYVRKLFEKIKQCDDSDYSLKNIYLSWVCLRDLVKTSRIRDQMIVVLTDEDGLQFLFLDFRRCENTLDSKEYYFKYQGQTVIEMLTPLLVHGKSTDLNNMFKSQEFWDFINLILLKHPFTNERYDLGLENDLICACEVYLNLLIAICNRNDDAIPEGFLMLFLSQEFIKTFTFVIKSARAFLEPRHRHTCVFYLFTIIFTLFDNLKAVELADLYFNIEDVEKEIKEFSVENFKFEVPDGCLRDYRKHMQSFIDILKSEETPTTFHFEIKSIVNLVLNMNRVPEKYEWEPDRDDTL